MNALSKLLRFYVTLISQQVMRQLPASITQEPGEWPGQLFEPTRIRRQLVLQNLGRTYSSPIEHRLCEITLQTDDNPTQSIIEYSRMPYKGEGEDHLQQALTSSFELSIVRNRFGKR